MRNKIFLILLLVGLSFNMYSQIKLLYPESGKQFETLLFKFEENLNFPNPFDLLTNKVELKIVKPDNSASTLSFFFNGTNKQNKEIWMARFTPSQIGEYHVTFSINDKVIDNFKIEVSENDNLIKGGLTLSSNNSLFRFENGEAFRGIGINICWANDYDYYFRKMNENGMNVTRVWMSPWHLSLEWNHTGLGKYDLIAADRLDEILSLAKKYDVYIILCMDYHGVAQNRAGFFNENKWLENPYNKINGGTCENAEDLFTDETAKKYFKQKYKYIISRFGYSANILAWEFYNEADLMAGKSIPINQWHIEMGEFVQLNDIHNRLVSSSATRNYPEKLIDAFKSPAMDFIMYHQYNILDFAPYVLDLHNAMQEYYNKPFVLGEFGIDYRGADKTYAFDPEHIGVHNAIWAGLFSPTPIIPLSWWWDNYIDQYNFWYEYKYLSDFSKQFNWNTNRLEFTELQSGNLFSDKTKRAASLVACIYFDYDIALWFKNDKYQWSLFYDKIFPEKIEDFEQFIPDVKQGEYKISWYDPQTGKFFDKSVSVKIEKDGILKLEVPSFEKDLACIIKYVK